jgi:hypothetical protein
LLAERVEGATGPDFDLDAAIAVATGLYVREKRGRDRQEWYYPTAQGGFRKGTTPYGLGRLPRFTASLDASLTLVPEGWFVWAIKQDETGWWVGLRAPDDEQAQRIAGGWGPTPTPALALTAAALRARHTMEGLS